VNDGIAPLGLGFPVEYIEGPPKGNWGSVGAKPGIKCPEEEGPLGEPDGVCAFNAWYPSGNVRLTLGVRGVLMGARLTAGKLVGTLEVVARWAI